MSSRPPRTAPHDPLVLAGVSRRFAGRTALAPLDLTLHAGAVCVVTGANGSGKTTLLRVAAGLLPPSSGSRSAPRPAIYLRPTSGGRRAESVGQAVAGARLLSGSRAEVDVALAAVGLTHLAGRLVSRLSAGEQARLALAVALAARPRLVCLDEPTEHLDDDGRERAVEVVRALAADGSAVLVATHAPGAFADVADAALPLRSGLVVSA